MTYIERRLEQLYSLDTSFKQIEADRLAWERERRSTRITLNIAWAFGGLLVIAYIGFYCVFVPIHEAGLHS